MQYEEYLIYLRKSRSDASLEAMGVDVLERHEQILLDLAKRMNLSIGGIYREVVSGESWYWTKKNCETGPEWLSQ